MLVASSSTNPLSGPDADPSSKTVTAIAIPTCERPLALKRALDTALKCARQGGHGIRLVVSDDSRDLDDQRSNRNLVETARQRCSNTAYLGWDEKNDLACRLAKTTGVDASLLKFGLGIGVSEVATYGANQNVLHLLTKGVTTLVLDDDIMLEPATSRSILSHANNSPERQTRFFADQQDLDADIEPHASAALAEFARGFASSADGPTFIVLPGLYGDSGSDSSANYLASTNPDTLRSLREDRAALLASRSSRLVITHVDRDVVVPVQGFMTACYAFRNDLAGVPFVPAFRGSDACYGDMIGAVHPTYRVHHLPWALKHAPLEPRRYRRNAGAWRVCDLVVQIVREFVQAHRHARPHLANLDGLARYMLFLTRRQEDFDEYLHQAKQRHFEFAGAALLAALETTSERSATYASAVAQELAFIEAALTAPSSLPDDAAEATLSGGDLRLHLRSWAELACVWPDLEAAAVSIDRARYLLNP